MDLLFSMIFGSGFAVIIAIAGIAIFLNFVPLGLWISAIAAGVNVGIFNLIGMRLRRVPASQIVLPLIKANKAGLDVNVNQLEAHYLAGGNVDRVIDALIAAHRAQIELSFERGCAIDLAGRNVLEAVQMSVNPEVIETPVVSAVAKDGIELKVKAYRVRRAILNILAAPDRRLRRGPISWYDSRRKEFDNIVSNFRIPSYRYLKAALTDRSYPDP